MSDSDISLVPLKKGQRELLEAMGGLSFLSSGEEAKVAQQVQSLTTRELADLCDLSIYKARHLLLDLVDKGYVIVVEREKSNSLGWCPTIN